MYCQENQEGMSMPMEDEEWVKDLINGINCNLPVWNLTRFAIYLN